MFLSHIRSITQIISYWGTALVRSMGGDYRDVVLIMMLNAQLPHLQPTPTFVNHTHVDVGLLGATTSLSAPGASILDLQFDALDSTLSALQAHLPLALAKHTNADPFDSPLPHKCYCSDCLGEISYNLLQYSLFPYLVFTQTQWWCHIYDDGNQNFFQSTAAKNKAGTVSDASLFQSQIELLQALEQLFEPIITSYMHAIAIYCSRITKMYNTCHRTKKPPQQPYFTAILSKTSHTDPEKVMHIPYSEQNVKETMNDLTWRIQQYGQNLKVPLDLTHWLFISHIVSICEMNNIAVQTRHASSDVLDFMTVRENYVDPHTDDEDRETLHKEMCLMYQTALDLHTQSRPDGSDGALPESLQSQEAYIDGLAAVSKSLMKSPPKRSTPVKKVAPPPQSEAGGDPTKAWALLQKRNEDFPEGSALYRVACTMNHNCDPNIFMLPYLSGRSFILAGVAGRAIKRGEELCISYIQSDELSYKERQLKLKDYQFTCMCAKCVSDKKRIQAQLKAKQQTTFAKKSTAASKGTPKGGKWWFIN